MGQFSKKWEDLNFSDNFIFCKVMKDEKLCKKLLEILLGIRVSKIDYLQTEHALENFYESRGIRMDVYLQDSDRVFDLEMQTGEYDDIILRSRYYQSSCDVSTTKRRTQFKNLKETFIIFICKDDPFGQGLPVYTKETRFLETNAIPYNDKTHNVFYNSSAWSKAEDKNIRDVLEFIYQLKANSNFTKELETSAENAKVKSEWEDEYMYFQDILEDEKETARETGIEEGRKIGLEIGLAEGREKGRAEGRAEGREEGSYSKSIEAALVLINQYNISPEEACESINAPLEVVKERLKSF